MALSDRLTVSLFDDVYRLDQMWPAKLELGRALWALFNNDGDPL